MKEEKSRLIRQSDLDRFRDRIRLENRSAFRMMTVTGFLLSIFNLATQMIVTGMEMPVFRAGFLMACFAALCFIDRVLIPEERPLPTAAIYAAQAPVLLLCILLGTLWDTDHQATSILLFLVTAPVFLTDHPIRVVSSLAAWSLLFIVLTHAVKDAALSRLDTVHMIEFLAAAALVSYLSVLTRLRAMKNEERMRYDLDHDRDTGCQNGNAFSARLAEYTGRPVSVIVSGIDQRTLYGDFYGKAVGDDILASFLKTIMNHYGEENTFHLAQDEALCLVPGTDREACEKLAAACRKETHAYSRDGYRIAVTFSQGWVGGTPGTEEELQNMAQLARIYCHRAASAGRDEDWYGMYTPDALEEASANANVDLTNLKPYETNPISGLPTMTYFCMRVDEMLTNLADRDAMPVVGYFKLIMLKEFNDEFGYQAGDRLIAETGKAMQEAFPYRLVGHITAGQFCFFCYLKEAREGVERLLKSLEAAHPEFPIRGKAGFAEFRNGEKATELLDFARVAQRSILNRPEQVCCQYNLDLDEELRFRQYIINHLDEAIEKEWLQVHYQPIVRASTGRICCSEALSRWNDPNRGMLMPVRFILPLEEEGLMYRVNLYVVERALKDRKRLEEKGIPVVPVSVNLSRNDFLRCDMVEEISARVAAAGYGPEVLRIEITESAFMSNRNCSAGKSRGSGSGDSRPGWTTSAASIPP